MKIVVTVKPNAKASFVEKISEGSLRACVKAPSQDGKANKELVRILAAFLHVPQSHITITHGASQRKKIIDVL